MRGWTGAGVCLLALLWVVVPGGAVGVAGADGSYVAPDALEAAPGDALEGTEVAGVTLAPVEPETPDVRTLIIEAARRWGVDENVLLRIAWCESRFDPLARGPAGLAGVFQFAPITWAWVAEKAGFPGASPYDARANVEAAAWLYKAEGPRHWGCK